MAVKTKTREYLGDILLDTKAHISDPSYAPDCWCAGSVENMLPGIYHCYATVSDEGDWGDRCAQIEVVHESCKNPTYPIQLDLDIGVDAGLCGIYDYDYFLKFQENWLERCRGIACKTDDPLAKLFDKKAIVSSSGFGDGGYIANAETNDNGQTVAVMVEFIGEDD